MRIEIHAHTGEHSSCSSIRAADLVGRLHARGIAGVAFTDHHYLWPEQELNRLRDRMAVPDDFLIVSGQEVTTADFGDVLVYGASEAIRQGIELAFLRSRHPEAALVWAHPYRYGGLPEIAELLNPAFDAIEIVNPHQKPHENRRAVAAWREHRFTATSGSDIHRADHREWHPVTVSRKIADLGGLVTCLKEGLCTPDIGPYGMSESED